MWPFSGKGKKSSADESGDDLSIGSAPAETQASGPSFGGNIDIELTKIKSQLEAFSEVRKANSERFSRVGEQIGELRGMIMDTNKTIGTIEVAATKAIDLVTAVQPDKLMIDVRKIDGKVEGLRAMLEANEAMMKDMMAEMKEMRSHMNFYKGVEQVAKMNDDIKKEMAEIKRQEAIIERHANKVETMFLEVEKKFAEFDQFNDTTKDLDKGFKKIQQDFDKVKVQMDEKAEKKEFVKVIGQFNDFEKHTGNILKLLDSKSKTVDEDLAAKFDKLTKSVQASFEKAKKEIERKQNIELSSVTLELAKGDDVVAQKEKEVAEKFTMKNLFGKKDKNEKKGAEAGVKDYMKDLPDNLGGHDDKPIEAASHDDKKILPGGVTVVGGEAPKA